MTQNHAHIYYHSRDSATTLLVLLRRLAPLNKTKKILRVHFAVDRNRGSFVLDFVVGGRFRITYSITYGMSCSIPMVSPVVCAMVSPTAHRSCSGWSRKSRPCCRRSSTIRKVSTGNRIAPYARSVPDTV